MDIFQRLKEERGITIVLITHEPQVAEYGSRIIRFKDGRVVVGSAQRVAPGSGRGARGGRARPGRGNVAQCRALTMTLAIALARAAPQPAADVADDRRHDDWRRSRARR